MQMTVEFYENFDCNIFLDLLITFKCQMKIYEIHGRIPTLSRENVQTNLFDASNPFGLIKCFS